MVERNWFSPKSGGPTEPSSLRCLVIRPPPAHSERVFHALGGPKRLISVPGAGHHDALNLHTLVDVDAWLDDVLAARRDKNNN